MRRIALAVVAAGLIACDAAVPAAKATAAPGAAIAPIAQEAARLLAPGVELNDAQLESFLAGTDLRKAYADRADELIAQLRKSRESVIVASRTKSASTGGRLASVAAALGIFIVPEFAQTLADALDEFTKKSGTLELTPKPYTSTETGATATTITTMSISTVISSSGPRVTVTKHWTFHTVQTDKTSGATLNDMTDDRTMVGAITVCPDTEGVSSSTLNVHSEFTGTANGVTRKRSASSGSEFSGQVNDSAALGTVKQTMQDKQSWQETSGDGSFDASLSVTYAFKEGAATLGDMNMGTWSGDFKASGSGPDAAAKSAAWDLVLDAYAMTQPYSSAQKLWRNGRCVMVAAPDYNAETPIEVREQEKSQHDERVDPSSETKFATNLKHRFGGPVSAAITTALSGTKTLEPNKLESSGSLTYKAPDEDDKKATARLQSTSKRGIGTLVLDFHTGAQALTLSLTGTLTGSQSNLGAAGDVSYSVSIGPLEFKQVAQNTWFAMGPWTGTTSTQLGVGGTSQNCKGSESGTASMVAMLETRSDRKVFVINRSQSVAAGTGTVECTNVTPIGSFAAGSYPSNGGSAGTFMRTLDDIVIPAEGGTIAIGGDRPDATGVMHAKGTAIATTAKK